MKVTEYNLLSARNPADMNAFVADAIANGWQPIAGVAVTPDGLFAQIMVKTPVE